MGNESGKEEKKKKKGEGRTLRQPRGRAGGAAELGVASVRRSDGVALAPVAAGAQELEVLESRRAAVGDGQDVVVLEVEIAAALNAPPPSRSKTARRSSVVVGTRVGRPFSSAASSFALTAASAPGDACAAGRVP